jgi:putative tryptophan/tyrosine transport system substrate-binding protein
MRRRTFIAGLGSTAAWPLAAHAQQAAGPVIGWLSTRNSLTDSLVLPTFRQALNAQGFVEGRSVTVEYRYADAQLDRLPALASDLAQRRVAVIVAVGNAIAAARAAQAASETIPIVGIFGEDPVGAGLLPNINRPGGNITGAIPFIGQVVGKRLGLLHDLLPHATTIAVLANPTDGGYNSQMAGLQDAAHVIGLQTKIMNASTDGELNTVFASLAQMRPDALFVTVSPFFFTRLDQIVASAARLALPTSHFRREFVVAGGLMSYASNTTDSYRVVGNYVGRVLKGEKPGDLPVEQPTKFQLAINLTTAKALGLTIPETMLATADAGIGGAAAWPLAARAQRAAMPVIGLEELFFHKAEHLRVAAQFEGNSPPGGGRRTSATSSRQTNAPPAAARKPSI